MVLVRSNQMISFDGGAHYNAEYYFGNPLNLEKVLEWELNRLEKGLSTRVTITGSPYKAFYREYKALRRSLGVITVREKCLECLGEGVVTKEQRAVRHWSGVEVKAFSGLVFKVRKGCESCEGFGYREFLFRNLRIGTNENH